jgi:hypothetical protein
MIFEFEEQRYAIVFQYDWTPGDDDILEHLHGGHRQMTRALIYKLPHAKGDDPIAQGTVYRHFKDKNSKEAARKAALKKVLLSVAISTFWTDLNSKAYRGAVWQAYLNRKRNAVSANAQNPQASDTGEVERHKQSKHAE